MRLWQLARFKVRTATGTDGMRLGWLSSAMMEESDACSQENPACFRRNPRAHRQHFLRWSLQYGATRGWFRQGPRLHRTDHWFGGFPAASADSGYEQGSREHRQFLPGHAATDAGQADGCPRG